MMADDWFSGPGFGGIEDMDECDKTVVNLLDFLPRRQVTNTQDDRGV